MCKFFLNDKCNARHVFSDLCYLIPSFLRDLTPLGNLQHTG